VVRWRLQFLEFHNVSTQFHFNGAAWKVLYYRRVGYPDCCTLKAIMEMEAGFRNVGKAYRVFVVRTLKQDQRQFALVYELTDRKPTSGELSFPFPRIWYSVIFPHGGKL